MPQSRVFTKREGIQVSEVAGEILLVNPQTDDVVYGNQSLYLIYELCDGVRTEEEIVLLLHEAYPDAGDLAVQVQKGLDQLIQAKIITAK